jgi:hypothetical protein
MPVVVGDGPTKWIGWMKPSSPVFDLTDSVKISQMKVAQAITSNRI